MLTCISSKTTWSNIFYSKNVQGKPKFLACDIFMGKTKQLVNSAAEHGRTDVSSTF
jgi:hypothetical protein